MNLILITMTDTYKVVLIGESGVGKTCIINQFNDGKFDPNIKISISAQFCRKKIDLPNGESITMDIWDTVGQETFRSITQIFYTHAKVAVIVYDVTNKKSFEEAKNYWYKKIQELDDKDIIIAIVANKYDLYEKKQVPNEEGEAYAKSIKAIFGFTSAKNNTGIKTLFENIAMKIKQKKNNKSNETNINNINNEKISLINKKNNKIKCC